MGLFSFFSGSNSKNDILAIIESVRKYMLKYAEENPQDMDTAVGIFDGARMMIKNASAKEISQLMKNEDVTAEFAALNVLQNCAMIHIKPTGFIDYVGSALRERREEDIVHDLYNWINKQKLEKGYISQKQFEENEHVGVMIRLGKGDYIR